MAKDEPKCQGCGMDLLSYLTDVTPDGGLKCLRCGTVNKMEEGIMATKTKAQKTAKAKVKVRTVQTQDGPVAMRFRDQSQEKPCHWVISGNTAHCKVHNHDREVKEGKMLAATTPTLQELKDKVLAYLEEHNGVGAPLKKGTIAQQWNAWAKVIGCSGRRLGQVVLDLLDEGRLVQPDPKAIAYRVARPKVGRKAA